MSWTVWRFSGIAVNAVVIGVKYIEYNIFWEIMLINFFLNNQPDSLIILVLFCYKTLHVSGIFTAHHQEFSTVHSALVNFMQFSDDRFQAESGWNWLTLLGSGHQKPT